MNDETTVRVVTIIVLGVILLASVISMAFVAVLTDRDLWRAEALTFAGGLFLAALGGLSWPMFHRRRHWRVNVERENGEDS